MEALGLGLWLRRETGAGQFTVGKLSITVTRSEIRLCSRHHNLIEDQMSVPADEPRITILRGTAVRRPFQSVRQRLNP